MMGDTEVENTERLYPEYLEDMLPDNEMLIDILKAIEVMYKEIKEIHKDLNDIKEILQKGEA